MSEGKAATSIVVHDDLDVAEQDYADGAALRRLREAVAPRDIAVRTMPDGEWWVAVEDWERQETPAQEQGATIAEAADKCCEALG